MADVTDKIRAEHTTSRLFWIGLCVVVVGVVVAGLNQPGTEVSGFTLAGGAETSEVGDSGVYALGLIVAGAGWTMLVVAIIAWGVALGVRMGRKA